MKILTIYASIHHENTKKIARAIHEEIGGKLTCFNEVSTEGILEADLVGFGSGIYLAKFHKGLLELVKNLPTVNGKKCFLFSTAGMSQNIIFNRGHKSIKKILKDKNFKIVGEFDCLGYDTYGPLSLIGGINKGRPDKKDLDEAKRFGQKLIQKENEN